MRTIAMVLAAAAGLLLSASVQASPLALPGAAPERASVMLVSGGCGPAYHPRTYRDAYGRLFTECVPNGPPVYAPVRRCAPGWHWRSWVDPYGRVHGRCVL